MRKMTMEPGLAAAFLAACGTDPAENRETAYQANLSKWKGGKPSAYSYRLSIDCHYLVDGMIKITVETDEVVKVDSIPGRGSPHVKPENYRAVPSVDELFERIQAALDDKAEVLAVEYDAQRGYPTRIEIDARRAASDAEFDFRAADLIPK